MRNAFVVSYKLFILRNARVLTNVYLNRRTGIGLAICLFPLVTIQLSAQTPDDLNAKFQAMEQRIKALESEVSALKAALGNGRQLRARLGIPLLPAQAPPSVSASGAPQLSDATARLMNPAISMIGNVLGAAGHNPVDQRPAFNVVESELALSAAVDPYARADVF